MEKLYTLAEFAEADVTHPPTTDGASLTFVRTIDIDSALSAADHQFRNLHAEARSRSGIRDSGSEGLAAAHMTNFVVTNGVQLSDATDTFGANCDGLFVFDSLRSCALAYVLLTNNIMEADNVHIGIDGLKVKQCVVGSGAARAKTSVRKRSFGRLYLKMIFCQDRLWINIGRTPKKDRFVAGYPDKRGHEP